MTKPTDDLPRPPFLGRVPTLVFVLLCIGASISGAIVVFILAALVSAIVDAIFSINDEAYKIPVILCSLAVGFLFPVIWLRSKRKKYRRRLTSKKLSQPQLVDKEPLFNWPTSTTELEQPAKRDFILVNEPPPNSSSDEIFPEKPTHSAPAKREKRYFDNPYSQYKLNPKKVFLGAAIIGAIFLVSEFSCQGDYLGLKLSYDKPALIIQNAGTEATTIIDLIINDRDECSTYSEQDVELEIQDILRWGILSNEYKAELIAKLNEIKKHKEDLHKLWIHNLGLFLTNIMPPNVANLDPITLKVGDIARWFSPCNVVRVNVKTDRGSTTYSFAN
ncbi:MAG: hypothetical protein ABSC37_00165 [Xanthobacteraceae bacterium]